MTLKTDTTAFIRANTAALPVPLTPEISLYVAAEATELWEKTEEELGKLGLPPPFWAFAWAGGQAVARYILDNKGIVAGRSVFDFASGSGLIAIAAVKARAREVSASELDPFAIAAMEANMALNDVQFGALLVDVLEQKDAIGDIITVGDVFYERELSERILAWLKHQASLGAKIFIGDPGRTYLPKEDLVCLTTYEVPVTRALEDQDIKMTSVWTLSN